MGAIYVSAVALVNAAGEVLIGRRPAGKALAGFWEFPGGKLEAGESPAQAAVRELREELDIGISVENLEPVSFVSYETTGEAAPRAVVVLLFATRTWSGDARMLEHAEISWASMEKLKSCDMIESNIPLLPYLERYIAHENKKS